MQEKISQNTHFNELDIMKGIGIWLVVIGHLKPVSYTETLIYSVHMFLFFFCSGFLGNRYKERSFGIMLWGNMKRLLFPYLVWGILSQGLELCLGYQTWEQAVKRFFFVGKWVGWNAPLWFLIVLFWIEIIGYVAVRANIFVKFALMVVSAVAWYLISVNKVVLWFGLGIVPIGLFFWLLGLVVSEVYQKILFDNWKRYILLASLFVIWILLGVVFNKGISVYHNIYSNYPFTLIAGCAGTVFLLLFSREILRERHISSFIQVYGRNTFFILCSHHFFLRLLKHYSVLWWGRNLWYEKGTIKALLIGTALMLLYLLILYLIRPLKKGFVRYLV